MEEEGKERFVFGSCGLGSGSREAPGTSVGSTAGATSFIELRDSRWESY